MVGKTNYSSVPTAVDFENNTNQKKYTVNRNPKGLVISRPLCTLMAMGALLLAVLVGLVVFFFVPRCGTDPVTDHDRTAEVQLSEDNQLYFKSNKEGQVDERLPGNVMPTHYRLQIVPYFDNSTSSGSIEIDLHAKEPTKEIIFHAKNLDIVKDRVRIQSSKDENPLAIESQDYIEGERYKIVLVKPLETNLIYKLELVFMGSLVGDLQGFYKSYYLDKDRTTKFLASTQFSPTDARRAFPCFDEPGFKANFSVFIGRPRNMSSLSNMPLEKSEDDVNNRNLVWDYYKTTPKMSPYLVAFVVSDLKAYGSSDKLIKTWSRESVLYQTRYAAELAPRILHFFEDYFSIRFPLDKIDMVAIPDFGFSAMENWGLITFRESSLLFDENKSDMDNKRATATVLAHELGHQWFGNLVTPKWWNDLWLKEGFATYLQYLGTNHAEPDWRIMEEFLLTEINPAYELDALQSSRPISFEVIHNRQIRQTFDALSYSKGASLVRMMNHFLGEQTFKSGLIEFLKTYQYANADRDDLFEVLGRRGLSIGSAESNVSLSEVMKSWVEQPGFPVVNANYNRGKLTLSQKRFSYDGTTPTNTTWYIPISMNTADRSDYDDTRPKFWLTQPSMTVNVSTSNWYLLNINYTGYFIVNYDEDNWKRLTDVVMSLPPLTRAQLISDSMDLARANILDYHIPLRLISRMAVQDADIMFVPTAIALKKLQYLSDMLVATPAFGLFEEFQSVIFRTTYRNVGSDRDYYSSNYLTQRIRRTVLEWACRTTDSECALSSHHMYRGWMEKNIEIPAVLQKVVYCTAIRQGTEAEWDHAYRKYLETGSVSEKHILLEALGCTTKKWLLSKYLDYMVQNGSSIRIHDAATVFKAVADNHAASSMAFDYLRTNWNELLSHYGEGFNIVGKMVESLSRYMNNEYQLGELINFRNKNRNNLGTTSQAFDKAIEKVRANVLWMTKNYESVEKWLTSHQHNYNLL